MEKRRTLYGLIALISILFILYTVVQQFVIDPGAEDFLSHKAGLEREPRLPAWLAVMRVHVVFACIAMASGLINFSNRIYEKRRKLHRRNGYVYLLSVLLVVLTSGYMAPYATGGKAASMGFNALNLLWTAITITALVQIRRKRIAEHRRWMIRSYAFCFTNLSIHFFTAILDRVFGVAYAASYTAAVYGSIALLLAIPEILFRLIPPAAAD